MYQSGQEYHLAITEDGQEYLGTISLKDVDLNNRNAEYAICLRKKAMGKGLAYEATQKVLEFAFDPREKSNYLPHSYDRNSVVYTGTHDNETLVQWYNGLDKESRAFAEEYMNNAHIPAEEKYWDFIRLAMMSCANTCIIPMQDLLCQDGSTRMNLPSTVSTDNWSYRVLQGQITDELAAKLKDYVAKYHR